MLVSSATIDVYKRQLLTSVCVCECARARFCKFPPNLEPLSSTSFNESVINSTFKFTNHLCK